MPTESPETRLALIEDRQDRLERTMESVAESLKLLARIEAQNDAISRALTTLDTRLVSVEKEMPELRQVKAGAVAAVKYILSTTLVGLLALVGIKLSH